MTNKKRPNSEKNKEQRERERENDFVFNFDISAQLYLYPWTSLLKGVRQGNYICGREIYTLNPKVKQFCDS